MIRRLLLLSACACAPALVAGCAVEDEVEDARTKVEQRADELRRDARREYERQREKIEGRVQEYLAQLEQAIPAAPETSPKVRSRGRDEPQTIDAFMEDVLRNIDSYWTKTLRASGCPSRR